MRSICSRRQRRARDVAARRIADQSGEVADQEDDGVAHVLEVFQLAHQHGVAEVQVGRGGIEAGLDAQRFPGTRRSLELGAQFLRADRLFGTLREVSQLFVDGQSRVQL